MLTQWWGSSRVRADRIARSGQVRRVLVTWRRSTADFVTQDDNLNVLGRTGAREQLEPAEQPDRDQI